eukprot:6192159-Pleurochrysis_carterae.AAC.3
MRTQKLGTWSRNELSNAQGLPQIRNQRSAPPRRVRAMTQGQSTRRSRSRALSARRSCGARRTAAMRSQHPKRPHKRLRARTSTRERSTHAHK